jgi:hypothetical protein
VIAFCTAKTNFVVCSKQNKTKIAKSQKGICGLFLGLFRGLFCGLFRGLFCGLFRGLFCGLFRGLSLLQILTNFPAYNKLSKTLTNSLSF